MTIKETLAALNGIEQNPIVKFVKDRIEIWDDDDNAEFPDSAMEHEYSAVVRWLVNASERGLFQQ